MREEEKLYEEGLWVDKLRKTASDRRQSIILHRKLLKHDSQDRRSGADRRRRKEKRIKPVYVLE